MHSIVIKKNLLFEVIREQVLPLRLETAEIRGAEVIQWTWKTCMMLERVISAVFHVMFLRVKCSGAQKSSVKSRID